MVRAQRLRVHKDFVFASRKSSLIYRFLTVWVCLSTLTTPRSSWPYRITLRSIFVRIYPISRDLIEGGGGKGGRGGGGFDDEYFILKVCISQNNGTRVI